MGTSISLRIIPNMAESQLASSSGPTLGHTIGLHCGHAPCQLLVDDDNANNYGGSSLAAVRRRQGQRGSSAAAAGSTTVQAEDWHKSLIRWPA